jgi:hypothetical protein
MKFSKDVGYQAFCLLRFAFVVAPLLAGADKFFNLLTTWTQYMAPQLSNLVHHQDARFMMMAGVVEMIAGIGVFFKPKVFAYIVSLWLLGIILNLLLTGQYFDIALRDLGLCLSALALGRLSQKYAA